MATKTRKKKAVAKKDDNAVAPASMMEAFAHDAGAGLENITKDDTKIPFLRVLQALSPQLQEGDPAYIEGAKAGMLLNSVTRELYDGKEGTLLIPVHFEKVFIEWKKREDGGGFVAQHDTREEAEDALEEAGHEGHEIVDTAHHYCLIRSNEDDVWLPIVVPCKSTMLSVSRGWNAMMQAVIFKNPKTGNVFTPPSYACVYSMTTARQQNDQGTWHNIVVERVATVDDSTVYATAKAFRNTLVQGQVALDYDSLKEEADSVVEAEDLPTF